MDSGNRKLSQDYAVGGAAQGRYCVEVSSCSNNWFQILFKEKCQQWIESSEFSTISNDDVSSLSGHSTEFISTEADSDISSIADDVANINITKIDKG